jgi:hypothetical protein
MVKGSPSVHLECGSAGFLWVRLGARDGAEAVLGRPARREAKGHRPTIDPRRVRTITVATSGLRVRYRVR